MFKRILVLVLFLALVFWWLSNRNDDQTETNSETVQTEVVSSETTVETDEIEDTDSPEDENLVTEDPINTESESTEMPEETVEAENTPVAPSEVPVSTPAAVTPVSTTPVAPVRTPAPVVVTVPDVQSDVKVYMYEWNIDMSKRTIPSGTVNFQVQNDGRFAHDFSIRGFGNLGKVNPGQSQTFTLKLKPGTYEVFSDRRQDYERGVKENFTVN